MPVVNFIAGGQIDFSNKYWVLPAPYRPARRWPKRRKRHGGVSPGAASSRCSINFVILAFIIFWMVKTMNRIKREAPPPAPAAPPEDVVLLREIRDALKR
jgi:large conductance mechanosensitive channel